MERESFPVGILIPNSIAKSLAACTALYKRASSPAFLQGHIQLADNDTPLIPCSIGAQTKLVKASAIANLEPQAGFANAATGACPMEVAIPLSPR